uniref:Uncharacterized protein n=1 Tax=Tetranychus urticae TaxID=32264 RepID=T1K486_TETUR
MSRSNFSSVDKVLIFYLGIIFWNIRNRSPFSIREKSRFYQLSLKSTSLCKEMCASIFYLFGGHSEQFNTTRLPVYIAQCFWATSWWNLVHYGQAINNDRFAKFDFGWIENYQRYGSLKPAEYKMGAINSQDIFILSAVNDPLANRQDMETLRKSLQVALFCVSAISAAPTQGKDTLRTQALRLLQNQVHWDTKATFEDNISPYAAKK